MSKLDEFLQKVSCNTSKFKTEAVFELWKPSADLLACISDIRISNIPASVGLRCVEIKYTRIDYNKRELSVIFM